MIKTGVQSNVAKWVFADDPPMEAKYSFVLAANCDPAVCAIYLKTSFCLEPKSAQYTLTKAGK